MSFETSIQTTIYTVLDAALSVPVYDRVPQGSDSGDASVFPYVTIGEDVITPWDTNTEVGASISITVNTWSRYKGLKETKELQGEIYDALHRQTLTVTGYRFIGCDEQQSDSFMDADGETRHGVQTFRILIDEL